METFTQPKITGYRQLTAAEAVLMNRAKALGEQFDALISELRAYHRAQRNTATAGGIELGRAEMARLDQAEPERWLSMGRTSIQLGVMQIVRSVAQPGG